jgi:hypothetical protein
LISTRNQSNNNNDYNTNISNSNSNIKGTEKKSSKKISNPNVTMLNNSYVNGYKNKNIYTNQNESEQLYVKQKKEFNNYIQIVHNLKSKNYLEKMTKLEMEKKKIKEKYRDDEWSDTKKIKLVKLNEDKLLLEVKRKNAFIDSFGMAAKKVNDNEDDVDEDNYKGIKNYHLNMGLGATYMYSLKYKLEPRYIIKNFKKKTIEKYKGNKGIFLGPNVGDIDRLMKMCRK